MNHTQCPVRYMMNQHGVCEHYLFPVSFSTLIGTILIPIITGLSSLAGLGGGGPSLVVFIIFFNYLPKDANIIVFTSILGATLGNCINQMTKSHNGIPIIQYKYAFISLPIMFIGSYFGVYLNSFLPSIVICGIILTQSTTSLSKIKQRYKQSYDKETKQILLHKQMNNYDNSIIKEERINPFNNKQNVYIFMNLILLILVFTGLLALRGTQKLPSLIGIQRCSLMYWLMLVVSLCAMGVYSYWNLGKLKQWESNPLPNQTVSQQGNMYNELKIVDFQTDKIQKSPQKTQQKPKSLVETHMKDINYYSFMAGVFSGFGLGGGLFLVPMYRALGCQPLEATASTSFTIVITAAINCIQGMMLGVIKFEDFLYFLVVAGGGSFVISVVVSGYLRKIHRFSYVELLLYILILLAVINIPISLFMKWVNSGYDSSLILSFGKSC